MKIVATIGERTSPAYDKLEEILGQGTIRINLAFCSKERYQELRDLIRRIRTKGGDKINILLDAVGPRVKLGNLGSGVNLKEGAEVVITTQDPKKLATEDRIGTIFKELPKFIKPGDPSRYTQPSLPRPAPSPNMQKKSTCNIDCSKIRLHVTQRTLIKHVKCTYLLRWPFFLGEDLVGWGEKDEVWGLCLQLVFLDTMICIILQHSYAYC